MHRFKKILVCVNTRSRKYHALMRAGRLAKETGARLKAIDVVKEPPVWHPSLKAPPWILPRALAAEKGRRLEKLVAPLRIDGVKVETEVFHGIAPIEAIREVLRNGHDLVMKTAEEEGLERLFGAADMRLLRKCPCPVWLVKPSRARRHARVLAAVDPDETDPEHQAVNVKIMQIATSLSALEGSELHVIHAWHAFGETVLKGHTGIPADELKEYLAETRTVVRHRFFDFLATHAPALSHEYAHLIKGDPARVIVRFAKERRISLIVMGTLARTGVAGVLIGNTAETVAGRIDCSLLAVKPDSFVSPVQLEEPPRRARPRGPV